MERPQRLLALLVALQANRQMTASELAEQFGVSKRTILRDVEALAAADIPVVAERGRYGGVSLLPGADVDVSRLTTGETEVLELIGVDLARAKQLGIEAERSRGDRQWRLVRARRARRRLRAHPRPAARPTAAHRLPFQRPVQLARA